MDLSSINKKYPNLNLQKMLSFIEGTLPEEEGREIEQQIHEDPLAAQAFTELEKFYYFNAEAKKKALKYKEVFDRTIDELPEQRYLNTATVKKLGVITAVAASLILIIFYVIRSDSEIKTDLYVQYFETYPVINTMRSGSNIPGTFEEGINYYENKEFGAAITALKKVSPGNKNYQPAQFYLAQSYMASSDIKSALLILSDIAEDTGSLFHSHAKWYLVLAYIKHGQLKEAKAILKTITLDEQAYKHSTAKILMEEMEE